MAEETNGKNGAAAAAAPQQVQIKANIVGQFLKDLSFENPNLAKLIEGGRDKAREAPNMKIEVNVGAQNMSEGLFESSIVLKAEAAHSTGTYYVLECTYSGIFKIESMPEAALEPFLLINAPTLLFPFVRRIIADITSEGGFPPLLLDPIDFAGLFVQRQREIATKRPPAKANV